MTDTALPSIPYHNSPAKLATNLPSTTVPSESASETEVCLIIHNLHWWTSDEDLRKFFGTRGAHLSLLLRSIRYAENKRSGRSMGVAVMTFVRRAHAIAALDLINAFAEVDDLGPKATIGENGKVVKDGVKASVMSTEQATDECKGLVLYLNLYFVLLPCLLDECSEEVYGDGEAKPSNTTAVHVSNAIYVTGNDAQR